MDLNETYWTDKYLNKQIGWDIGYPSPAIVDYFKTVDNKEARILVPGGGNGYEVKALFEMGFSNIFLLDFALPPLQSFADSMPEFPSSRLIKENFFEHHGTYDYIVEQTFFCALKPSLRERYVQKMYQLLAVEGVLVGLLFNISFNKDHPPFGGERASYELLFQTTFAIAKLEKCTNSIPQREGNELFIEMKRLEV
jgi:hypothetical protein